MAGPEDPDLEPPRIRQPEPEPEPEPDFEEDPPAREDEPEPEQPVEFDPRHRNAFEGLLYLGHLSREFSFGGHRFLIRTLDSDAIDAVGLLHKEYRDSLADMTAYKRLLVAACLVMVDNEPLPRPLTTDANAEDEIRAALPQVGRYSPFIRDVVYNHYRNLEREVTEVLGAMGNQ